MRCELVILNLHRLDGPIKALLWLSWREAAVEVETTSPIFASKM